MTLPSRPSQHDVEPETDTVPAPLDFDQAHDEDHRPADTAPLRRSSKQRRTGADGANRDAPGAEVMADEMQDDWLQTAEALPLDDEEDGALDDLLSREELADIAGTEEIDEADEADIAPVGRHESKALRAKIAKHARDPNAFEPAEAEVQRAIGRGEVP